MPTPTYTPLANITLNASVASVTFSSIGQGFRDLVLVFSGKGSASFIGRLNGDTATNYAGIVMNGDGSSTESVAGQNYSYLQFFNSSLDNPLNGSTQAHINLNFMDYSATDKYKTVLARGTRADGLVGTSATRWNNTSAITSIEIRTNFIAGDSFALYGIAS
jgi:hypothetical protein